MKLSATKIILIGCGLGIVYGLLNGFSNVFLLPSAPIISLRPQIALPMIVGIMVNPLAGFITGFTGNIIGDGISGFGFWKFWNWHIANGLMGLIPGLIRYRGISRIATVREFGILQVSIILACGIGVGFAVVMDVLFLHFMVFPSSLHAWILPAFLTDVVNGFVLVPVALVLTGTILITLETRTIMMITALLIIAVLATAGSITWAVFDDLVSHAAMVKNFYIAAVVSVLLLVIGFIASIVFVRKMTDPLTRITRAAESVEKGNYDLGALGGISGRNDELGRLARVFEQMAGKVREREKKLQKQVEELQIRIDREKQLADVAEIVETDYFRNLKEKARKFRES